MAPNHSNTTRSLLLVRATSVIRSSAPRSSNRRHARFLENTSHRTNDRSSKFRSEYVRGTSRPPISRSRTPKPTREYRHVACGLCRRDHRLLTCSRYTELNLHEKYDAVIKLHYCINCLARSHLTAKCTSSQNCATCNGKHHTSLHGHPRLRQQRHEQIETGNKEPTRTPYLISRQTLIPTAMIRLQHDGVWHSLRALINPTRPVSIIAAETVRKLRLPLTYLDAHRLCKVEIGSHTNPALRLELHALVSDEFPKRPYPKDLTDDHKSHFGHLVLADPDFTAASKVMIELGADVYQRILLNGVMPSNAGLAIAQCTAFGWTLTGPCGF